MNKIWETKQGELIPYKELEDSHLLHILKWIKKRAEEGITIQYGGSHDIEDTWYEEEEIEGKEVLEHYDYKGLLKEAKKRGLLTLEKHTQSPQSTPHHE